ncbi:MAG: hypothetical protein ABIQ35_11810 [Verrucomicrobiota bacterium]
MTLCETTSLELELPNSLEFRIHELGQQTLDCLAKILAEEWTDQREKD